MFVNLEPVIVTVTSVLPARELAGEMALMIGAPAGISLMENSAGFVTDLGLSAPSTQSSTVTSAVAELVNRSAGMEALNTVLLTSVVGRRELPVFVLQTTTLLMQVPHSPWAAKP